MFYEQQEPTMTNEDYIGKKLSECPDGTVAVVEYGDGCGATVAIVDDCGWASALQTNGEWHPWCRHAGNPIVRHIIKLGEPRPKTLADIPKGEAWVKDEGTRDAIVYWRDRFGNAVACFNRDGIPIRTYSVDGHDLFVTDSWRRLGDITGLMIDGKPWPAKDGDE